MAFWAGFAQALRDIDERNFKREERQADQDFQREMLMLQLNAKRASAAGSGRGKTSADAIVLMKQAIAYGIDPDKVVQFSGDMDGLKALVKTAEGLAKDGYTPDQVNSYVGIVTDDAGGARPVVNYGAIPRPVDLNAAKTADDLLKDNVANEVNTRLNEALRVVREATTPDEKIAAGREVEKFRTLKTEVDGGSFSNALKDPSIYEAIKTGPYGPSLLEGTSFNVRQPTVTPPPVPQVNPVITPDIQTQIDNGTLKIGDTVTIDGKQYTINGQ